MSFITDNFKLVSNKDNINQLKELVVELAIRGKLIPVSQSDEPANQLLKKIQQKKNKAIKAGRIRKMKTLLPIPKKYDLPFDIPETWIWCRFGSLADDVSYGTSQKAHNDSSKVPILRMGNITSSGRISYAKLKYVDPFIKDLPRLYLKSGDIIFNRTNSYELVGKSAVFKKESDHFTLASYLIRVVPSKEYLNSDYISFYLNSKTCRETQIEPEITKQTNQANFNGTKLKNILFPLPPLPEQHRIVQKVNTLFQQIDQLAEQSGRAEATREQLRIALLHRLEQAPDRTATATSWQPLAGQFDLAIRSREDVQALRQTILQLAVKGALVPQDANDEPAGVLLKRIKAEKERLVKAGEIRKAKALPGVREEEKPFELPVGWVWCRLGDLIMDISSGWSPKCYPFPTQGEEWGVLKVSAVSWDTFKPEENKKLPENLKPKKEITIEAGDYLMSRANTEELVAKSVIAEKEFKNLMMSDKILRVSFFSEVSKQFIKFINNGAIGRDYFAEKATGTSKSMKNVSRDIIKNLPIPLPPLPEQRRIVQKVEALLEWCDDLEVGLARLAQVEGRLVGAAMRV